MDNYGNAVIAYTRYFSLRPLLDFGIYANRLSTAGSFERPDHRSGCRRLAIQPVGRPGPCRRPVRCGVCTVIRRVQVTEMSASDTSLATLGPVSGIESGDQHRRLRSLPGDLYAVQFVVRP